MVIANDFLLKIGMSTIFYKKTFYPNQFYNVYGKLIIYLIINRKLTEDYHFIRFVFRDFVINDYEKIVDYMCLGGRYTVCICSEWG